MVFYRILMLLISVLRSYVLFKAVMTIPFHITFFIFYEMNFFFFKHIRTFKHQVFTLNITPSSGIWAMISFAEKIGRK